MKDIDFLPAGFRQQHSGHNVRLWRFVVVAGFLAMLTAASLVQYFRLCHARGQLAQLVAQHEAAKRQNEQLNRLQSDLKKANCDAELFTYLRHPWPRTQVLAALLAPMPDSVTLNQLEIKVDLPSRSRHALLRRHRKPDKRDEQAASLLPAELDLAMLREQLDSVRVAAVLSGHTTDPAALHYYLSQLGHNSLIAKAELDSLESIPAAGKDVPEGTMSFRAVVTLQPGYDQPGGPAGSMHLVQHTAPRDNHPLPNPSRDREEAVPCVSDKLETALARISHHRDTESTETTEKQVLTTRLPKTPRCLPRMVIISNSYSSLCSPCLRGEFSGEKCGLARPAKLPPTHPAGGNSS